MLFDSGPGSFCFSTPDNLKVIGHVPRLMASWLPKFPTNKEKVIVKGERVKRGGGFGLEVPCEYQSEGDSFSCG